MTNADDLGTLGSMNFLCHAMPYFDNPLLAISTGIPDWLSVVDRKIRARRRLAIQFLDHDDPDLRAVAQGVIHHIEDDRWFHGTQAFVETNMRFAVELRDLLPGDEGFRPTFVGHILIEMLLDSFWLRDDPSIGKVYYECFSAGTPAVIERCVNAITGKPSDKIAPLIDRYVESKFLYDYLDDDKLLMRLNQVMHRVGLPQLPAEVGGWLPDARKLVESRRQRLLTPADASSPFPELPSH